MERAATLVWWGLLLLCAAGLWAAHAAGKGGGTGEGPSAAEELGGRWAVGAGKALGPVEGARVVEQLKTGALPPRARLRMVPVVAEVEGAAKAKEMLEGLRDEVGADPDFDTLWRIYVEQAPPPPDPGFVRRNGWFARLALSRGLPDSHPLRKELMGQARRTFLGSSLAVLGALGVLVAGIVLLPIGLSRLAAGRLRFAYEPPARAPGDRAWLETVTILLAGVIATAFLGPWSMWALVLVPFWPLARGVGRTEWREGLGLVRGKGILTEVGAGLLGYLAGAPIYALGFLLMLVLSRVLGEEVTHPAVEEAAGSGFQVVHLLLAAGVWAPFVEEACFRGAFQRYLRPRMSRLLAAALVGLLFAVVHPQGVAAVPPLMAIGGWFALLREWRGTLVPSIAAHAVHNLALVSLAILVFS